MQLLWTYHFYFKVYGTEIHYFYTARKAAEAQIVLGKTFFHLNLDCTMMSLMNIVIVCVGGSLTCPHVSVGPGPGRYGLPPTIGFMGHDFTKSTSPAYSFHGRMSDTSELLKSLSLTFTLSCYIAAEKTFNMCVNKCF